MEGSLFPVPRSALKANISIVDIPKSTSRFSVGSATITRLAMNHPGRGSAYCIEADDAKVAYITDNELYPPYKKETDFIDFAKFAQNADLLIHDAQYMLSDMPAKNGWGHSVAEEAVKLAMACNAKKLALYSHDPERTDDDIDDVVNHCNVRTVAESNLQVFASSKAKHWTSVKHNNNPTLRELKVSVLKPFLFLAAFAVACVRSTITKSGNEHVIFNSEQSTLLKMKKINRHRMKAVLKLSISPNVTPHGKCTG